LKFVWSEVLSENLSRLSSNYFAAKHFLEREVLPAIDRDLKVLEESVKDQQDQEDKGMVLSWIDRYRKVKRDGKKSGKRKAEAGMLILSY